ncbi:MAG: DUF3307 domain-containing protein [Halanaerobiaceae bacterium]
MSIISLALLVLSHILADFTFQNKDLAEGKQKYFLKLLKHILIYFILSVILTIFYFNIKLIIILLSITVIHGLIDYFKILFEQAFNRRYSLEFFLFDQLLHITVLIAVYPFVSEFKLNIIFQIIYDFLINFYPILGRLTAVHIHSFIIIVIILIFNFKASNIIVNKVLIKYRADFKNKEASKGTAIGNLERLLVLIFVLMGTYSLVGLLFTAKSLIRFKELENCKDKNTNFVEYYLIGTFTSILIAIISGLIIKFLLNGVNII